MSNANLNILQLQTGSLVLYLHIPSDNGFTLLNACTELHQLHHLKSFTLYQTSKAAFFLQSSNEPLKLNLKSESSTKILQNLIL